LENLFVAHHALESYYLFCLGRGRKSRITTTNEGSHEILVIGCSNSRYFVHYARLRRADGTVKMAYEFGMFEMPKIDMQQGQDAATQRCKSWGYTNAEAFGGQTKTCSSFGGGACNSWLVTVEYQCTGGRVAAQ
jgi:hypothetical protein